MNAGTPPPGWYDDPLAAGSARWWDGHRWTDHTRDLTPPPTPPPPPAPIVPPPLPASSRPSSTPDPMPTASPPRTPPPTPAPTSPMARSVTFTDSAAVRQTSSWSPMAERRPGPGSIAGTEAIVRTEILDNRPRWRRRRVLVPAAVALAVVGAVALNPDPGTETAATDAAADQIDPLVGSAGDPADTASSTTSGSGQATTAATIATTVEPPTTASTTTPSTASSPSTTESTTTTATTTAPTSKPTTTVAPTTASTTTQPPTTAAPTTTTSGCDPNYSGACVPIASDVDCLGGSGNGPAYVQGPVTVIGTDIYGLDRDGDGIGCEP